MYGFLGIMTLSLVSLAVLQYRWLGSVSEAEKERLEESVSASSENFVADFNRVFAEVREHFRIQVTSADVQLEPLISESYLSWINEGLYPGLVDSVFVLRSGEGELPSVYLFTSGTAALSKIKPGEELLNWIRAHCNNVFQSSRTTFETHPDFGEQTFMPVPIQLLDVSRVSKEGTQKNLEARLNIDRLDELLVLQLDDALIKEQIIPNIARTYFSDSYEDQYSLSLVNSMEEPLVYFTSSEQEVLPEPDFRSSLYRFSFSNIIVFKSDSVRLNFTESDLEKIITGDSVHWEGNTFQSHIFTEDVSQITIKNSDSNALIQRDTTISASLGVSIVGSWELWLNFKEGSLNAFVNKTRIRNLGISFGILGILGISVVMIVTFFRNALKNWLTNKCYLWPEFHTSFEHPSP